MIYPRGNRATNHACTFFCVGLHIYRVYICAHPSHLWAIHSSSASPQNPVFSQPSAQIALLISYICSPPQSLSATTAPTQKLKQYHRPGVLVRLSLAGKRLGDEGTKQLSPALATVRSVDLRQNNIGDIGSIAIAAALRAAAIKRADNKRLGVLETLSLAGNRVGDAGGKALSEVFEDRGERSLGNLNLRWLSVAGNPSMSDSAKERLVRAGSKSDSNPLLPLRHRRTITTIVV